MKIGGGECMVVSYIVLVGCGEGDPGYDVCLYFSVFVIGMSFWEWGVPIFLVGVCFGELWESAFFWC